MQMRYLLSLAAVYFIFQCSTLEPDYKKAKTLFDNFDTVITPQEYARTYYYHRNQENLWLDENNQPVTLDVPYRDHFVPFGTVFVKTQSGGLGINSRYIIRYIEGRNTLRMYHFPELRFENSRQENLIYLVYLDSTQAVTKAKLYSNQGLVLKEDQSDFISE